MEHEQRTIHEPSSSSSAYCSTLEGLDAASSSVYTSAIENAEELTSSRYWTSIEDASDSNDEGYVCVHPGRDVPKFEKGEFILLEKIREGGQGVIYNAQLSYIDVNKPNDHNVVVKLFKGRCGQWPGDVYGLHSFNPHICKFHGYYLEGESFYLVMAKYDCSLRDLLDHMMKDDKCKGRPLPDIQALLVIIQIALGMCFLHENNIIHRDLKADNVFVTQDLEDSGGAVRVCVGDFDVASNVVGTLFWRAPEVLQALKEGKRPVFTPKADVYSYAMTCYEILTGDVPLEGVGASYYDAVLQHGTRPKLPSSLNSKMKDLMSRCWHQDPEARPTFKEIVVELKELQRELITGSESVSKVFDRIFSYGSTTLGIAGASPEASLLELKALVQALQGKYGKEDFVLLCLGIVADLERYQSEFGLRSFEEHPVLPFPQWFARLKLYDKFRWKLRLIPRLSAPIVESARIAQLLTTIMLAIKKNYTSTSVQSGSGGMLSDALSVEAWEAECNARVLPEFRHVVCLESPEQACNLCRPVYTVTDVEKEVVKCCLYVDSGFTSMVSSLATRIRTML